MPRTLRRAAIVSCWVAGVLALLLTALFAAVLLIDVDAYRPTIQRQLSALFGREVLIERVAVAKSLHPAISIEGLKIANPAWASRPDLLMVRSAAARLDLLALLHGQIEMGEIEVHGVDVTLERNASGMGNWVLAPRKGDGGEAGRLPDFDRIAVRDAVVYWRDGEAPPIEVHLDSVDAVVRADAPLRVAAAGRFRQVPLQFELKANTSIHDVLDGGALSAQLSMRGGGAQADVDIAAASLSGAADFSLNLSVRGENLGALSALVQRELPAWGPYQMTADVRRAGRQLSVSGLRLNIAGLPDAAPFAASRLVVDEGKLLFTPDQPASVAVAGLLDDTRFLLGLTSAPPDVLLTHSGPLPVAAKLVLDDFELALDGQIVPPQAGWSFEFVTALSGDLRGPARLLGVSLPATDLPAALSSRVAGDAQRLDLTAIHGEIAGCTLSGELSIGYRPRWKLRAAMQLGRLDLGELLAGAQATQSNGEQAPGAVAHWLDALDADLDLRIDDVAGLPVPLTDLAARVAVGNGRLALRGFRGSVAATDLLADATLRWRDGRPHLEAALRVPRLDLAPRQRAAPAKGPDGLDRALPLSALQALDADLSIDIGQVGGAPVSIEQLRAKAHLQKGRLRVPALTAAVAGVPTRQTLALDVVGETVRLRASSALPPLDLAALQQHLEITSTVGGELGAVNLTLDTQGRTPRQLIANAKLNVAVAAAQIRFGEDGRQLSVDQASVLAGPDLPVTATVQGSLGEVPLNVVASGGHLIELLEAEQPWPQLSVDVATTMREQPVRIHASSALTALRKGRDVPLRVVVRSAKGYAMAQGTVKDLRQPAATPLDVVVNIDSLADLPLPVDAKSLPDIDFAARAQTRVAANLLSFTGLSLRVGQTRLSGNVKYRRGERSELAVDLSGDVLDLRPWVAKTPAQPEQAAEPVDGDASVDRPFDLAALRRFDASLHVRARNLIAHRFDLNDFKLAADLRAAQLDGTVSIGEGRSALAFSLDARSDSVAMDVRGSTSELDLESLKPSSIALSGDEFPRFSGHARLVALGTSRRQMLQSASGEVLVSIGPGELGKANKPFMLQAVSADLLATLMPGEKPDDYARLECAAAHFDIADGVATSPDGIALRFKRVDILGSGAVNLATREILFGFKALRRKWLSFSLLDLAGDFASIGGTLDKPKVTLDTRGALFTGGAAWATGGLSLLATDFMRRATKSENPCQTIIEKGHTDADPYDALLRSLQLPPR